MSLLSGVIRIEVLWCERYLLQQVPSHESDVGPKLFSSLTTRVVDHRYDQSNIVIDLAHIMDEVEAQLLNISEGVEVPCANLCEFRSAVVAREEDGVHCADHVLEALSDILVSKSVRLDLNLLPSGVYQGYVGSAST